MLCGACKAQTLKRLVCIYDLLRAHEASATTESQRKHNTRGEPLDSRFLNMKTQRQSHPCIKLHRLRVLSAPMIRLHDCFGLAVFPKKIVDKSCESV